MEGRGAGLTLVAVFCALILGATWAHPVEAALPLGSLHLDTAQSSAFRSWFLRVVTEQLRQGPSPRWTERDCAGLVRFAVIGALAKHDEAWLRANGVSRRDLPPELGITGLVTWDLPGTKKTSAYASALALVQANTRFVSRDINQASAGDLLFFDQGDDQHLMIWMDGTVAYHNGARATARSSDDGLREIPVSRLLNWKDTRWQPTLENPNFAGVYRFAFLSP